MHTTEATQMIDSALVSTLCARITHLIETADPDLTKLELRIAGIAIDDRNLLDQYGQALREELCPKFREQLYYVSVQDYTGRNGKRFLDVSIEMKRGLLI